MSSDVEYAVSRGVWLKIREEYDSGYTYKIITPTAWAGDVIAKTRYRLSNRKAFKSTINSYTHNKGMPRVHICGSSVQPVSTYFCAEPLYKLSDLDLEVNIVEQIKRLKNLKGLLASSPDAIVPDICPEYACTYYGTYIRKVINYEYSAIDEICDNIGAQETLEKCMDGSAKKWKTCVPPGYWVEDEKICIEDCVPGQISVAERCPDGSRKKWKVCGDDYRWGPWLTSECEFAGCPDYNVEHGETFCKNFDLYRCEDGSHILVETNSKDCGYVPECTEGDKRNVVLCPNGEFMRSWEECVSGTWVAKTGVCGCAAGTISCQGYNLYTCTDGEWVLKERNSVECGYTENGKVGILDPIVSWIEISFDVDRKTAEMYAYLGIAGVGAVVVLGVMSK